MSVSEVHTQQQPRVSPGQKAAPFPDEQFSNSAADELPLYGAVQRELGAMPIHETAGSCVATYMVRDGDLWATGQDGTEYSFSGFLSNERDPATRLQLESIRAQLLSGKAGEAIVPIEDPSGNGLAIYTVVGSEIKLSWVPGPADLPSFSRMVESLLGSTVLLSEKGRLVYAPTFRQEPLSVADIYCAVLSLDTPPIDQHHETHVDTGSGQHSSEKTFAAQFLQRVVGNSERVEEIILNIRRYSDERRGRHAESANFDRTVHHDTTGHGTAGQHGGRAVDDRFGGSAPHHTQRYDPSAQTASHTKMPSSQGSRAGTDPITAQDLSSLLRRTSRLPAFERGTVSLSDLQRAFIGSTFGPGVAMPAGMSLYPGLTLPLLPYRPLSQQAESPSFSSSFNRFSLNGQLQVRDTHEKNSSTTFHPAQAFISPRAIPEYLHVLRHLQISAFAESAPRSAAVIKDDRDRAQIRPDSLPLQQHIAPLGRAQSGGIGERQSSGEHSRLPYHQFSASPDASSDRARSFQPEMRSLRSEGPLGTASISVRDQPTVRRPSETVAADAPPARQQPKSQTPDRSQIRPAAVTAEALRTQPVHTSPGLLRPTESRPIASTVRESQPTVSRYHPRVARKGSAAVLMTARSAVHSQRPQRSTKQQPPIPGSKKNTGRPAGNDTGRRSRSHRNQMRRQHQDHTPAATRPRAKQKPVRRTLPTRGMTPSTRHLAPAGARTTGRRIAAKERRPKRLATDLRSSERPRRAAPRMRLSDRTRRITRSPSGMRSLRSKNSHRLPGTHRTRKSSNGPRGARTRSPHASRPVALRPSPRGSRRHTRTSTATRLLPTASRRQSTAGYRTGKSVRTRFQETSRIITARLRQRDFRRHGRTEIPPRPTPAARRRHREIRSLGRYRAGMPGSPVPNGRLRTPAGSLRRLRANVRRTGIALSLRRDLRKSPSRTTGRFLRKFHSVKERRTKRAVDQIRLREFDLWLRGMRVMIRKGFRHDLELRSFVRAQIAAIREDPRLTTAHEKRIALWRLFQLLALKLGVSVETIEGFARLAEG